MSNPSRTLTYRAKPERTIPEVGRFVAEHWPEAADPDPDMTFFVARYQEPVPHSISIYVSHGYSSAGGVDVTPTDISVSGSFEEDPPSTAAGRRLSAELERRIADLATRLESHLHAAVTPEYTSAAKRWSSRTVPATSVALAAARGLGDAGVFKSLIEKDSWTGTVAGEDGTPVHLKLEFEGPEGDDAGFRPFVADASIRAPHLDALGDDTARELTDAVVGSVIRRVKAAPRLVGRLQVTAGPVELPAPFYDTSETLTTFIAQVAGHTEGDSRSVVIATEPGVRAELVVDLDDDGAGRLETTVSVAVEQVARPVSDADRERWQQAADGIATALTQQVVRGVAPSFSVGAPIEETGNRVRDGLQAMFPSETAPDLSDGTFSIYGVPLADDVYGSVVVRLEAVAEWETRVTFTGGLYGSGLSDNPAAAAAARAAYRDAIARAATQLRDELATSIDQIPPQRPDIGLA